MTKNNNGFTLLELLVSLAIIGMILLGFFKVLDSTTRINTKNDRDIKALNLLQSEIEGLREQIKSLKTDSNLIINDEMIDISRNGEIYNKTYLKTSDGKEYDINLILSKKDCGKKIYLFDLDVSAKVVKKDKYFSSKETKLTTFILSNNHTKENVDEFESAGELSEYNIRIHGPANWETYNSEIKVGENGAKIGINYPDYSFQEDRIYNLKEDAIYIDYMKNELNQKYAKIELRKSTDNILSKSPNWLNLIYQDYLYVSIYIKHTGLQIDNLEINGKSYKDIGEDVKIPVYKSNSKIQIKIDGITKMNNGDHTGPNSGRRGDIFIRYS